MLRTSVVLVALLAVVALPSLSPAEGMYLTNLEMVERVVRAAVDSMEVAPPLGGQPPLEIEAGTGSEASWLLDNVLKANLIGMGWSIKAEKQPADTGHGSGASFLLRMRIVDLSLKYGRSWRRYLFAGKMVERVARVAIYYELIDKATDRILVSSNVKSEISDVVPASLLPTLGNSQYGFASPELGKSQWDRYLEGGLVMAIIGVLVYLFYSNKTAS